MENQCLKNSNNAIPIFIYSGNKLNSVFFLMATNLNQTFSIRLSKRGGSIVKALNISSPHPHICGPKRNQKHYAQQNVSVLNESLQN